MFYSSRVCQEARGRQGGVSSEFCVQVKCSEKNKMATTTTSSTTLQPVTTQEETVEMAPPEEEQKKKSHTKYTSEKIC